MSLPEPVPGLVLHYSYLWHNQHRRGLEEGTKDRPCLVLLASAIDDGGLLVTVAPVTHSPPGIPPEAVEIPAVTKQRLGLDGERSWVVVTEVNRFRWPGPDLRRIPGHSPAVYAYGMIPPSLFHFVKAGILHFGRDLKTTPRDS